MPVNRNDPRPLHAQVADDLRDRILHGEFAMGDKLPSLRTLADQYSVAELTAHDAVRALQRDGVLKSTSGRGTFVQQLPDSITGDVPQGEVVAEVRELRDEVAELRSRVDAVERAQKRRRRNVDS